MGLQQQQQQLRMSSCSSSVSDDVLTLADSRVVAESVESEKRVGVYATRLM